MKISEWMTNSKTGRASTDRTWYNISYAAATIVFLAIGLKVAENPTEGLIVTLTAYMTVYLAIVAGSKFASKIVAARSGMTDKDAQNAGQEAEQKG